MGISWPPAATRFATRSSAISGDESQKKSKNASLSSSSEIIASKIRKNTHIFAKDVKEHKENGRKWGRREGICEMFLVIL